MSEGVKWTGAVYVDKKGHSLGLFDDEIAAARAYDKAAKNYAGNLRSSDLNPKPGIRLSGPSTGSTAHRPGCSENYLCNVGGSPATLSLLLTGLAPILAHACVVEEIDLSIAFKWYDVCRRISRISQPLRGEYFHIRKCNVAVVVQIAERADLRKSKVEGELIWIA